MAGFNSEFMAGKINEFFNMAVVSREDSLWKSVYSAPDGGLAVDIFPVNGGYWACLKAKIPATAPWQSITQVPRPEAELDVVEFVEPGHAVTRKSYNNFEMNSFKNALVLLGRPAAGSFDPSTAHLTRVVHRMDFPEEASLSIFSSPQFSDGSLVPGSEVATHVDVLRLEGSEWIFKRIMYAPAAPGAEVPQLHRLADAAARSMQVFLSPTSLSPELSLLSQESHYVILSFTRCPHGHVLPTFVKDKVAAAWEVHPLSTMSFYEALKRLFNSFGAEIEVRSLCC